ncbi:MAG: NUDIX hydrolase [Candidatus Solibacter usitatus]|nr:NUDIX hydrolase [Candidatus Solibacter usitatus]
MIGIGALIFRRNRILLAQRGKTPLKGWWSLPGGALETGEWLAEGVRREVLEETGLHVVSMEFFTVFERLMPDANGKMEYHYVLHDYICKVRGEARPGSDVSAVEWVREQDVKNYRLTEGTLEVIVRAFRGKKK